MIQELMIINKAGIALFYHSFIDANKTDDHQSLAGYFDLICRFTKRSFKESLKILALDSFIFFFYTHNSKYRLVFKCLNKEIDKKILEDTAESIIDNFLIKFGKILEDFNGEVSNFSSFKKIVEDIISTRLPNFKKVISIEH